MASFVAGVDDMEEEIVAQLPPLELDDVWAALRYAAETAADREIPLRNSA